MHSQKNSEIRRVLTETRCGLTTATSLQHLKRLAGTRSARMISSALRATDMGLEGLVSKHRDRRYQAGRSNIGSRTGSTKPSIGCRKRRSSS
jgi:hypothetical protein